MVTNNHDITSFNSSLAKIVLFKLLIKTIGKYQDLYGAQSTHASQKTSSLASSSDNPTRTSRVPTFKTGIVKQK
jgi:hypothetical protein